MDRASTPDCSPGRANWRCNCPRAALPASTDPCGEMATSEGRSRHAESKRQIYCGKTTHSDRRCKYEDFVTRE